MVRGGRRLGRHAFDLIHLLVEIAVGLLLLGLLAAGGLALRLAYGPIQVDWLLRPTLAAINREGPTQVRVGHLLLAWQNWRGSDQPVQLRAEQVEIFTPVAGAGTPQAPGAGTETELARFPEASVSLALSSLLTGKMRPRVITLEGAAFGVTRQRDGTLALDLGSLSPTGPALDLRSQLVALGLFGDGEGSFSQLREVRVADATVRIAAPQPWQIAGAALDLVRASGGWHARATLPLQMPQGKIPLTLAADIAADGAASVRLSTEAVRPDTLAAMAPPLARLAAIAAPVTVTADARFDPAYALGPWHLHAALGAGALAVADGSVPIAGGALHIEGAADASGRIQAQITSLALDLDPPSGKISHLTGSGTLAQTASGFAGTLQIGTKTLAVGDLPALWPLGLAPNTRRWVTGHLTGGTARDLHAELAWSAASDWAGAVLTRITAGLEGEDVSLIWIHGVPPATHAAASVRLLDQRHAMVTLRSARQGDIAVSGGSFAIDGIGTDQPTGTLALDAQGELADLLRLLAQPSLKLLSRHPLDFTAPSGTVVAHLGLTLPLRAGVRMEELAIHATARARDVHLGQVAAGRDLAHATLGITADNGGLRVQGQGDYDGIPVTLAADRDFHAGGPDQVVQHVTAHLTASVPQIRAMGYDPAGLLDSGTVAIAIDDRTPRMGTGRLAIEADLTQTALHGRLGWRKEAGSPGHASAVLSLRDGALVSVPSFSATAPGLAISGQAALDHGRIASVTLAALRLNRTDAAGSVAFPRTQGDAYRIALTGKTIDLSGEFAPRATPPQPDEGPHLVIDASFAQALMANGVVLNRLAAHVETDHNVTQAAMISLGEARRTTLTITPGSRMRALRIKSQDAGTLLLATDTLHDLRGGALSLEAQYDDSTPQHRLAGTASITDFRISDAPAVTKLLQALTGYGLIALAQGPGLAVSRFQTEFTYQQHLLTLTDARAHSPSIGFTAQGSIDTATGRMSLHGTIVPAYLFNNALSNLPLVGGLFSAERGGGILAVTFSMTGSHQNPKVSVDPLSGLAPGFLRGMFNGF